MSFVVR